MKRTKLYLITGLLSVISNLIISGIIIYLIIVETNKGMLDMRNIGFMLCGLCLMGLATSLVFNSLKLFEKSPKNIEDEEQKSKKK